MMSACANSTLETPRFLRHAFGIANAGAAQIDGEKARLRRLPGELDGDETCAAPGDEDIADVLQLTDVEDRRPCRRPGGWPARIRIFFVLAAHGVRHVAIDPGPGAWNRRRNPAFFGRVA